MPSGIEGSNPKEARSYEALCSTQTGERVQNPQLSRSGLPPAIVHNSDHVEGSAPVAEWQRVIADPATQQAYMRQSGRKLK